MSHKPQDDDRVRSEEDVDRLLKAALGDKAMETPDHLQGVVVVSTPHHEPHHDVIINRLRERDDIIVLAESDLEKLPPPRKQAVPVGTIGHVDHSKVMVGAALTHVLALGLAQSMPVELPSDNTYGPGLDYPRSTDPRPVKKANKASRPRWRR